MGVTCWPMVELEADDALASAARLASADERVERVVIWTPDKDLAQCVVADRVVQADRRSGRIRDASGVHEKYGVPPARIADWLALVGDSADGYPGIAGIGAKTAARLIERHGAIEDFPDEVLGDQRAPALLFKRLATLRTDAALFDDLDSLRWSGPTPGFDAVMKEMGGARLRERIQSLSGGPTGSIQLRASRRLRRNGSRDRSRDSSWVPGTY